MDGLIANIAMGNKRNLRKAQSPVYTPINTCYPEIMRLCEAGGMALEFTYPLED